MKTGSLPQLTAPVPTALAGCGTSTVASPKQG